MVELAPEIPSPIDFEDPIQVRDWITSTVQKRHWRPRFFSAFAAALNAHFRHPMEVVELGSGPGHLAKAVIDACNVSSYTAVDFSSPMHDFARHHLEERSGRVRFILRDFRREDWTQGLAPSDAVLTMQAVHEVRHRSRQPQLLATVHGILKPGGLLLYCDHYSEAGTTKNPELFLKHEEQPEILRSIGFLRVEELLDFGGMALYRANKS